MATQHDIALTRALAELPGPLPPSGVIHVAIPHASRFTIVGNHLAQHAELSLIAIGIGVHIQSLPTGSEVGIKALASRFTEGETRIAAALRELEAHGYLHRTRVRLTNGRLVTRTVFCDQPGAALRGGMVAAPVPLVTPVPAPAPLVTPAHVPVVVAPAPAPSPSPSPEPTPVPEESHPPVRVPSRTAPKAARRPLPRPRELTPELRQTASAILAGLRSHAKELVLSEDDVEALVPGVAAWLERDAHPDTIRHALTTELPQPPKHPAKIVKHRLTVLLPPPLPGAHELAPVRRTLVIPLQNCDGCDRAFRATAPGHCRGCRNEPTATAA
ncbi:hypothetical protein OHB31_13340 [Streptomyces microflavus]|uniref:hypothetical protein n=1 Tax=Streptomyces microflavus TaxID=1919 RepID=UPI0022532A72|nr:hypothetical protein [Streptomyces microflavus]MCX4652776.1 hypothetical protein [Streptomyces microflavus]WSA61089.1 hypothetical protein OHB31_13340 [Streptomyces microflavus]